MALIAAHLNAGHSGGDSVAIVYPLPLPPPLCTHNLRDELVVFAPFTVIRLLSCLVHIYGRQSPDLGVLAFLAADSDQVGNTRKRYFLSGESSLPAASDSERSNDWLSIFDIIVRKLSGI